MKLRARAHSRGAKRTVNTIGLVAAGEGAVIEAAMAGDVTITAMAGEIRAVGARRPNFCVRAEG